MVIIMGDTLFLLHTSFHVYHFHLLKVLSAIASLFVINSYRKFFLLIYDCYRVADINYNYKLKHLI